MVQLDDLPAELVVRIAKSLLHLSSGEPRPAGRIPDLYQFALVNKQIHYYITHDWLLSKWKFGNRWIYNYTGLYARTTDILRVQGSFFPGTEDQAKQDRRDIFAPIAARHKLDQEARSRLRDTFYLNGGNLGNLLTIAEFGVNIVDLLFNIRGKALRLGDREIPYACDSILKRISCARGEEILRSIYSHQSKTNLAEFDSQTALRIMYAVSACYDCSGLTVDVTQFLGDVMEDILSSKPRHCRSSRAEDSCTCVRSTTDVFDDIMHAFDKKCLTGVRNEDSFQIENMFSLNAYSRKKPVSLLSLCTIFCAFAEFFHLPCSVSMLPSGPVIKTPCTIEETDEPVYFVPDLEPGDRIKPESFLLDMIMQDDPVIEQEAIKMIKPVTLDNFAAAFAWDVLNVRGSSQAIMKDSAGCRGSLTALKVLHLSGKKIPLAIKDFATLLTRGDEMGVQTWRKELGKIAQLGGSSHLQLQEAEDIMSNFWEAVNQPIEKPFRAVPDRVIRFSHGAIVRHKKHGYLGIIYGFEDTCKRPQEWQEKMRVNKLRGGGADQPFYLLMCPTFRWVAEVNLEAVSCSACADRQASPACAKPTMSRELEQFIRDLETPALGTDFRARKNGGACGFLPSRLQLTFYPASIWPPHANACVTTADDISAIDDAIFG